MASELQAAWAEYGPRFVEVLMGNFPSQVSGWGREAIASYCSELQGRGITPREAAEAVRSVAGDFPPSAANLAAIVERKRQGPVPDYMTAMRIIASKVTLLDYHHPARTFDAFVAACAREHEAIGRFALEMGPQAVRQMPDPRMAQDTGGSAATTRLERSWRKTGKEWEADPTPGLALEEAKRVALSAGGEGRGGMTALVDRLRPAAGELEAGDA